MRESIPPVFQKVERILDPLTQPYGAPIGNKRWLKKETHGHFAYLTENWKMHVDIAVKLRFSREERLGAEGFSMIRRRALRGSAS